jgi:hypothetical protein
MRSNENTLASFDLGGNLNLPVGEEACYGVLETLCFGDICVMS